ncbi:MAG: nitroreductase family protein [Ilumatobacteraceae bacterium]|nr:nitroreductase family protein [Ilumatobacter sp.]MCO5331104.1 nitroreductase family protein [Ilumatobacteraceae bacterium]
MSEGSIEAIIRRRRMTRMFDPAPLPAHLVTDLLTTALRAPSAGFSQGVHFLALDGDALAGYWARSGAGEWFGATQPGVLHAPLLVVALAEEAAYTTRYSAADKAGHGLEDGANWPVPYWLTDTAMAVQNLLLLAEAHGLGALWFGVFGEARAALDELGVPASITPVGAVTIGHRAHGDVPSGSPTTVARRPTVEVLHRGRW